MVVAVVRREVEVDNLAVAAVAQHLAAVDKPEAPDEREQQQPAPARRHQPAVAG